MSSVTLYRQEHFVQFCNQRLSESVNEVRGLEAALIATPDGFSITSVDRSGRFNADKLSAVSSSVFALSSSLVNEFDMQDCHSVMIGSATGTIHVTTINSSQHHLILVLESHSDAMIAAVMHAAKKIRTHIKEALEQGILEK